MAIGLGCMRLSTEPDRDDDRSLAVLRAALDAGVDLLNTADAYARDEHDIGHNERLIARALEGRSGVRVVTKGGIMRPGGAWVPNGRAKHLEGAARASRARLGTIDAYLLHVVDPKVPLATSVRGLAKVREAGVAKSVGVSNVNLMQLEEALSITEIAMIEIELGPWKLDALRGGLIAFCEKRGIEVLAYRPLGGRAGVKRARKDDVIEPIARRLGATEHEVILAWLRSLSPVIVPIPGATRIETAHSAAKRLALDADAKRELDAALLHVGAAPVSVAVPGEREVVMISGMPGAGKSTLAQSYVARGYHRLNRDERGGTLVEIAKELDRALSDGIAKIVVDNTYGTRASRATVLEVAQRHGAPVRCIVLVTTLEQAQTNAAARIIERHGRLPANLKAELLPSALFRFRRSYEPPRADEGFASIEEQPFVRASSGGRPALIVELDGLVWHGKPRDGSQITLRDGVREQLAPWSAAGYVLGGTVWRPGQSIDLVKDLAERLSELLALPIDIAGCPHLPGPPKCWCRKPLPGMGLLLARKFGLDLARSIHVGRGPADRGFAERLGMRYFDGAIPSANERSA